MQKLNREKFNTIKTQRCTNEDCPVYKMFSTQTRARYYQLIYSIDKCCFDCFGWHTEADKRRKPFDKNGEQEKLTYTENYMLDFSSLIKKSQKFDHIKPSELLIDTCLNNVEHLYHPLVYKTINCPFVSNSNDIYPTQNQKFNFCTHIYCPFLHKNESIDKQLQEKMSQYRIKQSDRQINEKFIRQKKIFEDKIMNIVLIRKSKSITDLQNRQVNLLQNQQLSSYNPQNTQVTLALSDKTQIQKLKDKLKKNVQKCIEIDNKNSQELESRKIIDKPSLVKDKQNKKTTNKQKQIEQIEKDSLGVSYNYFKYGQKLSLIESRTIEFKHFKDISDPNHIPLIMRYVTAFLNTEGGKLYIGVDDNSYVFGSRFKQSQYDKLLLSIDRQCRFCLNPPLMPQKYSIKLIPVYQDKKTQDNERWVIEITVFPTKESKKRLFLYNHECYMRMNASTHKLNASDIIEFINLNSQHHAQQIEEKQQVQKRPKSQNMQQNDTSIRQQVTFAVPRENQLIHQNKDIQKATKSTSKTKFQTQESKINEFQQQINKKSIQDLYLMKKDYEQKLMTIIETYKKKQRQMR